MPAAKPAVQRQQPPKGPFVVINSVMRHLLMSRLHPVVGDRLALLTFTGRKSGRTYRTPVGVHDLDGGLVTLTSSVWRHNFRRPSPVTLHRSGRDLSLTATLIDDPDAVAGVYTRLIDRLGYRSAGRQLGIKINLDRAPTHDELAAASRASGLSVVSYKPRD